MPTLLKLGRNYFHTRCAALADELPAKKGYVAVLVERNPHILAARWLLLFALFQSKPLLPALDHKWFQLIGFPVGEQSVVESSAEFPE